MSEKTTVSNDDKRKKNKNIEKCKKIIEIARKYRDNTHLKETLQEMSGWGHSISSNDKDKEQYHLRNKYEFVDQNNISFFETFSYLKSILGNPILSQIPDCEFNLLAEDIAKVKINIEHIIGMESYSKKNRRCETNLVPQPKIDAFIKKYYPSVISNVIRSSLLELTDNGNIANKDVRYAIAPLFIKIGEALHDYRKFSVIKSAILKGFDELYDNRNYLVHGNNFATLVVKKKHGAVIMACIREIKTHLLDIFPPITFDGNSNNIQLQYEHSEEFIKKTTMLRKCLPWGKSQPENETQILSRMREEIQYFFESQSNEQLSREWKTLIEGYIIIRVVESLNELNKKFPRTLKSVGFIETIRYIKALRNTELAHGAAVLNCDIQSTSGLDDIRIYIDAMCTLSNEEPFPVNIDDLRRTGVANAVLGHYSKAISAFERALKMFPPEPIDKACNDKYYDIYLNLADVYIMSYHYEKAHDIYNLCLKSTEKLQAKLANLLQNKAFCLEKMGKYELAVDACRSAVTISNESRQSQQNLAMTLYRSGRRIEAIELVDKIHGSYNDTADDCIGQFALESSWVSMLLDDWKTDLRVDDVKQAIRLMEQLLTNYQDVFKKRYDNQYFSLVLTIIDQKLLVMTNSNFRIDFSDTVGALEQQFHDNMNGWPLEEVISVDVSKTFFTFCEAYSCMTILAKGTSNITQSEVEGYLIKADENFKNGEEMISNQTELVHSIKVKRAAALKRLDEARAQLQN